MKEKGVLIVAAVLVAHAAFIGGALLSIYRANSEPAATTFEGKLTQEKVRLLVLYIHGFPARAGAQAAPPPAEGHSH